MAGPTLQQLENYLKVTLAKERQDATARYNAALQTHGFRAQRALKDQLAAQHKDIEAAEKNTRDAIARLAKTQKGAAATDGKPLTTDQALKREDDAVAQTTAGKLAKSKEEQIKELKTEKPDVVAAIQGGSATGNYAEGQAPTSTVNGQTVYAKPSTVTLTIPQTKDPDAIAAEKQRREDLKDLQGAVAQRFGSFTTKPTTPEVVFGAIPKKSDKGGLIGQGFSFPAGYTMEDWQHDRKQYEELKQRPDTSKFRQTTMPAAEFERALGRYNAIVGPENGQVSPVDKEIYARQLLDPNRPAPDSELAVPEMTLRGRGTPGMRIGGMGAVPLASEGVVPRLNPGEVPSGLRAASAGKSLAVLNAPTDAPSADTRMADKPFR